MGEANWQSSQDVLQQVEAVGNSLRELNIDCLPIPFDRDLGAFMATVKKEKTEAIFNLCESVDDDAKLIGHPAAVFELLGIPFSGSGSLALMLSTDKLLSKRQLSAAGIRTPASLSYDGGDLASLLEFPLPAIIKPRLEDASIGIDQDSIIFKKKDLKEKLPLFYKTYGPLLLEQFIDGREFNISLFGYPAAHILPVAEIDFSAFPKDLQKIVGYRAKWDEEAFEYHNTNRIFPDKLPHLLEHNLRKTASATYKLFMLRDYGRIDLRVDHLGKIYVLEANANPCLTPDAGFAAAASQCKMSYTDVIRDFVHFLKARVKK
jgi:D-alanine-D-alanine ligase